MQTDNAKDFDTVVAVHNLLEYSNNYSKTSGSLWQYFEDEPAVNNDGATFDFVDNYTFNSFKFKEK